MGLLNWLFGKTNDDEIKAKEFSSKESTPKEPNPKEVLPTPSTPTVSQIPISQIAKFDTGEGTVVAESKIPAYCGLGNLNFNGEFDKAIEEGEKLLKQNPNDAGVHINLMDSYFKARKSNPTYLEKCNHHAKRAILNGHNTGYAEDRLVKNLTKDKLYYQAIQLCDIVLRDDFHFSKHGMGKKEDYSYRRSQLITKLAKSLDTKDDLLFSTSEVEQIIQSIRDNDERELREQREWEEKMKRMEAEILEENKKLKAFLHGQ